MFSLLANNIRTYVLLPIVLIGIFLNILSVFLLRRSNSNRSFYKSLIPLVDTSMLICN